MNVGRPAARRRPRGRAGPWTPRTAVARCSGRGTGARVPAAALLRGRSAATRGTAAGRWGGRRPGSLRSSSRRCPSPIMALSRPGLATALPTSDRRCMTDQHVDDAVTLVIVIGILAEPALRPARVRGRHLPAPGGHKRADPRARPGRCVHPRHARVQTQLPRRAEGDDRLALHPMDREACRVRSYAGAVGGRRAVLHLENVLTELDAITIRDGGRRLRQDPARPTRLVVNRAARRPPGHPYPA